ncbi:YdeI/OmpD-associated family protein [Aestuariivivens insulae]|uniref:YdeI/OmpD-associated family protein n=1 Tax=Aestuariivivens insulae TaxID=1621988 RepID=UPI001F57D3DE|nr:DUF1801 domain-containing protein [Aestuariivivens insulae]
MQKVTTVEAYIETHHHYREALTLLRDIINTTELEETIKWNAPVYTLNGKNVLGISAFKNHFGIWFFNGVFLKDEQQVLLNAQEGKTKAMRQMRFNTIDEIDKNLVLAYVKEAIENQKLGKVLKPEIKSNAITLPAELKQLLDKNTNLYKAFNTLTPYKQREFCEYITTAKREATKQARLEKIKPLILKGIGLNDKYKNS